MTLKLRCRRSVVRSVGIKRHCSYREPREARQKKDSTGDERTWTERNDGSAAYWIVRDWVTQLKWHVASAFICVHPRLKILASLGRNGSRTRDLILRGPTQRPQRAADFAMSAKSSPTKTLDRIVRVFLLFCSRFLATMLAFFAPIAREGLCRCDQFPATGSGRVNDPLRSLSSPGAPSGTGVVPARACARNARSALDKCASRR